MRAVTIVAFAVAVLLVTSAVGFCQTARAVGMGYTGVGLADDAGAWLFNPAGLPHMNIPARVMNDDPTALHWQAIAGDTFGGDIPGDVLDLGAVGQDSGAAIGRIHLRDLGTTLTGFGFGTQVGKQWSFGASILDNDGPAAHQVTLNAGAMYQWNCRWAPDRPVKIGLTLNDLTKEVQTTVNGGVSFSVGPKVLVAADLIDITNQTDTGMRHTGRQLDAGLEYKPWRWLALRAGEQDGDWGWGAGVRYKGWQLDYGNLLITGLGAAVAFDGPTAPSSARTQLLTLSRSW